MSIGMSRRNATGRATCQICLKKIKKGLPVIYAQGWRTSGYCHANPSDCGDKVENWRGRIENE